MRISDWSSDVCSSDLTGQDARPRPGVRHRKFSLCRARTAEAARRRRAGGARRPWRSGSAGDGNRHRPSAHFLGLALTQRAAAIAALMQWLGYTQCAMAYQACLEGAWSGEVRVLELTFSSVPYN